MPVAYFYPAEPDLWTVSMDSDWDISVCGLNCAKCDIHMASHGDEEKRREILDWFRKERGLDLNPEQIVCEGCMGPLGSHWSPDCGMMLCAKERGLGHCFECGDFPCDKVEAFASDGADHHRRAVENARRMGEMGLEAWIEEQGRKGPTKFCP